MLMMIAALAGLSFTSCANNKEHEVKAVPPTSPNSPIPWNSQGATGGGQGQFGMLQQNQYRR